MKKYMIGLIFGVLISVIHFSAYAQRSHGKPGNNEHGHGRRGHGNEELQVLTEFKGSITDFTFNDEKAYNGFLLNSNGQNVSIKFRTDRAKEIMGIAKKGSTVSLLGFKKNNREGKEEIILNSITVGSKTVYEKEKATGKREWHNGKGGKDRHGKPEKNQEKEEFIKAEGKIITLAKGLDDKINGVYLDKTLIRFNPNVAVQLGEKLAIGKVLAVTGYLKKARTGEVLAENIKIIRAQTITLDGVTYAIH